MNATLNRRRTFDWVILDLLTSQGTLFVERPQNVGKSNQIATQFDRAWSAGAEPRVEDYLAGVGDSVRSRLLSELLAVEFEYRKRRGEDVEIAPYLARFPEHAERIKALLGLEVAEDLTLHENSTFIQTSRVLQHRVQNPQIAENPVSAEYPSALGNFRIVRQVGVGGMGYVLEAEDTQLHRRVALKVMKRSVAENTVARERFLREARATAALRSDFIIPIYQVGEANGVPFIAMPLLRGETLEARLNRIGRIPVHDLLRMATEIASGLAAAHDASLIHRDIKPSNLWLESPHDRIKILDFGLARVLDDELNLTSSGAVVGTPRFMSPEQADGSTLDERSDLFSLGSVMYLMATGQPAFPGKKITAILHAIATCEPTRVEQLISDIPPKLSHLIMDLLQKSPDQRPRSASSVSERLGSMSQILSTASRTRVAVGVVNGDVREVAADVLVLKHAQEFLGADLTVAQCLLDANVAKKTDISPLVGKVAFVPSQGAVVANDVLFVGTPSLDDFTYQDIRQLAELAIGAICVQHPNARTIAVTVHGVNFGLDIAEAVQSLMLGIKQALARSPLVALERILIVERNPKRCEWLLTQVSDLEFISPLTVDYSKSTIPSVLPAKKSAFVAMPMDEEVEDLYEFGIYSSVRKCGYICERMDDSIADRLLERARHGIENAGFVIADLTSTSPLVYFAIGCAVALGKPVLSIIREGQQIPPVLQAIETISYRTIRKLAETMETTILKSFGPGESPDAHGS